MILLLLLILLKEGGGPSSLLALSVLFSTFYRHALLSFLGKVSKLPPMEHSTLKLLLSCCSWPKLNYLLPSPHYSTTMLLLQMWFSIWRTAKKVLESIEDTWHGNAWCISLTWIQWCEVAEMLWYHKFEQNDPMKHFWHHLQQYCQSYNLRCLLK